MQKTNTIFTVYYPKIMKILWAILDHDWSYTLPFGK